MAITLINVTRQVDISYCWYYQTQGLASSPALTVTVKVYLAKCIRFANHNNLQTFLPQKEKKKMEDA